MQGKNGEKPDLYGRAQKYANNMRRLKESAISECNKALLLEFVECMRAQKMSLARLDKYLHYLMKYADMLGVDFEDSTIKDVQRVIAEVNSRDYSPYTKHDICVLVKRFHKWLEGEDKTYPDKVSWIKTTMTRQEKQNLYPKAHEIPSPDDVKAMIGAAGSLRDRCFIALLFDSACRIGELLNVQVKDISIHGRERGFITVTGKTGTRKVYVKFSVPYIGQLLDLHPKRADSDFYESWLFLNNKGGRMGYATANKILKVLKQRAGVKAHVKVNPHSFRHAQITELFRLGVNEPVTKKQVGWADSSRMVEVYSHLTTKDVEDAIDQAKRDVGEPEPRQPGPNPMRRQICMFCSAENTPTAKYCEKCGTALDKASMLEDIEAEKEMLKYLSRPSVIQAIRDELRKDRAVG